MAERTRMPYAESGVAVLETPESGKMQLADFARIPATTAPKRLTTRRDFAERRLPKRSTSPVGRKTPGSPISSRLKLCSATQAPPGLGRGLVAKVDVWPGMPRRAGDASLNEQHRGC